MISLFIVQTEINYDGLCYQGLCKSGFKSKLNPFLVANWNRLETMMDYVPKAYGNLDLEPISWLALNPQCNFDVWFLKSFAILMPDLFWFKLNSIAARFNRIGVHQIRISNNRPSQWLHGHSYYTHSFYSYYNWLLTPNYCTNTWLL